ncbi:hypothetical protein AB0D08_21035 [Kitasatospora sp. NPDC048540]|uniref:hypothetical protein n=1 Tax=unclassified Kitasatospora TaxID=2633591 RepID=UPI0007C71E95|nr:hypothetical protein [Kitasatospora sp. MBT63]
MILLGVLLLAAAGAFTGLLIADNLGGGPDYTATVLGTEVATVDSLTAFLAGIALTLLVGLGGLLIAAGVRRSRRRSAELRTARAAAGRTAPAAYTGAYPGTGTDPVEPVDPVEAAGPAGPDPDTRPGEPGEYGSSALPGGGRRRHGLVHRTGH